MSKRSRLKEIMTRAGLIDDELALERAKAQRGAQTTNATLHALSSLIDTGANVVPRAYDVAADHMAQDAMAPHATTTPEGDAATEAARAVEGAEGLQPSAAQDPFSFVINAVSAPARAAAKQRATAGLTERFTANQERSRADARQRDADARAAERHRLDVERAGRDADLDALNLERGREGLAAARRGESLARLETMVPGAVVELEQLLADPQVVADEGGEDALLQAMAARIASQSGTEDALVRARLRAALDERKRAAAKVRRSGSASKKDGPDLDVMSRRKLNDLKLSTQTFREALGFLRKEGINTGPLRTAWEEGPAPFFGVESEKWGRLNDLVSPQMAEKINELAGAALTETEKALYLRSIPTVDDEEQVLERKLVTLIGLQARREHFLETGEMRPLSEYITGAPDDTRGFASPLSTAPPPLDDGMVLMQHPSGRTMRIPRENAEAAKALGAVEVR